MIDQMRQRCGDAPGQVLADSGFFSVANLEQMEEQNLDGYVPDSNLAQALNLGMRYTVKACAPVHQRCGKSWKTTPEEPPTPDEKPS
jgi:hypothetical protein